MGERMKPARPKRAPKKNVIFNGSGVQWMPVPTFFLGSALSRGAFWTMNPSPELRMYMVLLRVLSNAKAGDRSVTIGNETVMSEAMLNRDYFNFARKRLVTASLIQAKRIGMSEYRYTILGPHGRSLSERPEDDYWGMNDAA
jgi:hypothetical protein